MTDSPILTPKEVARLRAGNTSPHVAAALSFVCASHEALRAALAAAEELLEVARTERAEAEQVAAQEHGHRVAAEELAEQALAAERLAKSAHAEALRLRDAAEAKAHHFDNQCVDNWREVTRLREELSIANERGDRWRQMLVEADQHTARQVEALRIALANCYPAPQAGYHLDSDVTAGGEDAVGSAPQAEPDRIVQGDPRRPNAEPHTVKVPAEPDRCPTCGSDDPKYVPIPPEAMGSFVIPSCRDPWHRAARPEGEE